MVYIVQVLVEHPTHALDTTFDYLANTEIASGVRVWISTNNRICNGMSL